MGEWSLRPPITRKPDLRTARALCSSAIRRALPQGVAAVYVGAAGDSTFIVNAWLTTPQVLLAAVACLPQAATPVVRVLTRQELAARR